MLAIPSGRHRRQSARRRQQSERKKGERYRPLRELLRDLRELLQELLLLMDIAVPLLLTLWQQQISVDAVEAGGGDGVEALPPEQPLPVVLVHIW